MAEEKVEKSFLELKQQSMEFGFWSDENKSLILYGIESLYNKNVIRDWSVTDMVIKDEKVIMRWTKRYRPLTDEELQNKYGK